MSMAGATAGQAGVKAAWGSTEAASPWTRSCRARSPSPRVTSVPVINADWQAPSGQKWTVPIGASIGRFARFGEMPVSVQAGYYYNIERPDGGSDWALRFQLRLLFPG